MRQSLDEQFREFHSKHPDVYELFSKFAKEAKENGACTYGAKSIMERIRWHYATSSQNSETFKINNNYTSRYARMLADEQEDFNGFFETRSLISKEKYNLKEKLASLGFSTIEEYHRCEIWTGFKIGFFSRHPRVCYISGLTTNIDLHHITYARIGAELDEDVIPLNKFWHKFVHHLVKEHKVKLEEAHKVAKKSFLAANHFNVSNPRPSVV